MHTFYVLRDILSKTKIIMTYSSLVESVLRYCITAWGGAFNTTLNTLQVTQNTILKIILKKDKLFTTIRLYNENEIFNIKSLFIYQCIIKVYNSPELFQYKQTRLTRSTTNMDLSTQLFKKSLTQRSFFYFGPKFYNLIPIHLKQKSKLSIFKQNIKKYIIDNQITFTAIML